MPRYFFHVIDDQAMIDTEGMELADHDEARHHAIKTASGLLHGQGQRFWKGNQWQMTVTDSEGP